MRRDDAAIEFTVIISEAARQMLINHVRFLAQEDPDAANKTKALLLNSIRSLSKFPARHPFLEDDFLPANKYHKMVFVKRYLIIYQIKDQTVFVDWIIDCRQDYKWLMR